MLSGAIYVVGGDTPTPELAESGPSDPIAMQLVAAAAAVGVGATFVAWACRRRTTISAR